MADIKDIQKLDTGFDDALKKVIDMRQQRRALYGDTWQLMEDWEIVGMLKQKVGRLQHFVIDQRNIPQANTYEGEIDSLVDLVNYSMFLLDNKLNKRNGLLSEKTELSKVRGTK